MHFIITPPTIWKFLPFVALLPTVIGMLGTWEFGMLTVIMLVVVLVLAWAGWGMRVVLTIGEEQLQIQAPFYRQAIELTEISEVRVGRDPGPAQWWLNWPVTGSATSNNGVRLCLSDGPALTIETTDNRRYVVIFPDKKDAQECADAVKDALPVL